MAQPEVHHCPPPAAEDHRLSCAILSKQGWETGHHTDLLSMTIICLMQTRIAGKWYVTQRVNNMRRMQSRLPEGCTGEWILLTTAPMPILDCNTFRHKNILRF